jgi:hypothetical protein
MFLALVGSIASPVLLWRIHDRQLARQEVDARGRPRQ